MFKRLYVTVTVGLTSVALGVSVVVIALSPKLAWSMGTPPFDAELRSSIGAAMRASLDTKGCLATEESIEVVSTYRKLKPRGPIPNKQLTLTVTFPGRDRKGSRAITVSYTATTNADGVVSFSIPMSQALEDARKALQNDRFYRGVTRVRGRLSLSLSTEDTFKQSIRVVPSRGFGYRLCRTSTVGS